MKATVLGIRTVDYDRKNGGGHVSGYELHYAVDPPLGDDEMLGQYAKFIFTNLDCSKLQPGELVDLGYELNPRWNRVDLVSITPA